MSTRRRAGVWTLLAAAPLPAPRCRSRTATEPGAQRWTLPAGADVPANGGNDAKTLQSTVSGAQPLDINCIQHWDGPTVVSGDVVGSARTDCDGQVTEMQILVELYWNGLPVGTFGHDQDFDTRLVQGWAQAPCIPGSWLVYAQTLVVAPPDYIPPDVLIYPSPLQTTWIGPSDCLPVIINMSNGDARNKIAQMGLKVGAVTHQPSDAPVDSVISWSLEGDNTTVDLVESAGHLVMVPYGARSMRLRRSPSSRPTGWCLAEQAPSRPATAA